MQINLLKSEQKTADYLKKSPMGFVPLLEVTENKLTTALFESSAILEWLEETHVNTPLLPKSPIERAHVRALVQMINAGIQPLHNLQTIDRVSTDEAVRISWIQHWVTTGLHAFEKAIATTAGNFCFGDTLSMADIFLAPQLYVARRWQVEFEQSCPNIARIDRNLTQTEAYQKSHADRFKPE